MFRYLGDPSCGCISLQPQIGRGLTQTHLRTPNGSSIVVIVAVVVVAFAATAIVIVINVADVNVVMM